jgi:hypothetical protein
MNRLLMLFVIAGLAGCGGVAVEAPGSAGASDPGAGGQAPASPGAAGTASGTGSLPTHALGDCKPGFARDASPTRECDWMTVDRICFDDKDAACNCVCPASGDSVCWSDFYQGPGSATLVHCD